MGSGPCRVRRGAQRPDPVGSGLLVGVSLSELPPPQPLLEELPPDPPPQLLLEEEPPPQRLLLDHVRVVSLTTLGAFGAGVGRGVVEEGLDELVGVPGTGSSADELPSSDGPDSLASSEPTGPPVSRASVDSSAEGVSSATGASPSCEAVGSSSWPPEQPARPNASREAAARAGRTGRGGKEGDMSPP